MTPEEQEELSMKQQELLHILKNTLNSARSRQATLTQASELWKEYQDVINQIETTISKSHIPKEHASTLSGVLSSVQKVSNTLNDVKVK